jgi:GTP cyclohydrolase II
LECEFVLLGTEIAKLALRQGLPVVISGGAGEAALVQAAEAIGPSDLTLLREQSGTEPTVVLSARRSRALGGGGKGTRAVVLRPRGAHDAIVLRSLVDPLATSEASPTLLSRFAVARTRPHDIAALKLAKLAGLLPAALAARLKPAPDDLLRWAAERGLPLIAAEQILAYEHRVSTTLRPVSRARVPLGAAEDAQLVAFRPSTGSPEHLAIIIGQPERDQPVLTRLHSECFTGDLLGSLRCDCGDQLRGAIAVMAGRERRSPLPGTGGARHRSGQQAARLRAAGPGPRYDRCQQRPRLRSRRAVLPAGRGNPAPAWVHQDTADDQ